MILENEMLDALRGHFSNLQKKIDLAITNGDHNSRAELVLFLQQIASCSEKIAVTEHQNLLRSAVSFEILADGSPTGILFSGIPAGHEFTSLILAILQAGGSTLKLDEGIQNLVKNVKQPLKFETFISLSCHNCPDVVQALNQFALLNPLISNEMIDGGLFQDEIEKRNIQGVPAVFLNGESFANGKIDTAKLVARLLEKFPEISSASEEKLPLQDVTIIGGGPAGSAAAIYAARKGLAVCLIADRIGGQVKDTVDIENIIGIPKTTGATLANNIHVHLKEYSITIKENISVKSVEKREKNFVLTLNTGATIESRTVIVASGAKWRELGVKGEKENIGNGVAFCPHCDGPFFAGKDIAVIGGGNSGVEAALDLSGIVKSVTLLEFMPNLKADQVLINQASKRSNIKIITNAAVQEIHATDGKVSCVDYLDRETNELKVLDLAAVFVQIGLVPNSECVANLVERTKFGEIIVNAKCETNIEGVFAAGDVTTVPYKQIVIAMGEGAKAALSAFDYLLKQ